MNITDLSATTVFVVDDDPAGRESLCDLLESRGLTCAVYASAEEFLAQCDATQIGCVVTDYKMPGMSGTDLQAALLARHVRLPVIVVSGFADVPVAVRAMQYGAVTLLQKPCDRGELIAAVEAALALSLAGQRQHSAADQFAARLAALSADELQVMQMLVEGQPNKSIARDLDLGLRTVERRRQQILEKMHVGSLPELASLLARHAAASNRD